jgi:hypothetical protein
MFKAIQLKQVIKFDLAVFFSHSSYVINFGFKKLFRRPWALCPLCLIYNTARHGRKDSVALLGSVNLPASNP